VGRVYQPLLMLLLSLLLLGQAATGLSVVSIRLCIHLFIHCASQPQPHRTEQVSQLGAGEGGGKQIP